MTFLKFVWKLLKCNEIKVLPKNHNNNNQSDLLLVAEHSVFIQKYLVRGIFGIRRDYVEMSNKKDYKIFRRTSKVLTRDIVFREVIRTLIPSMNIDENGTGHV